MTVGPHRLLAIVMFAVLLVAGALVNRSQDKPTALQAAAASAPAGLMPTAAPTGALNATWYCPASPAGPSPGGVNTTALTILNPTAASLTARVTVVPSQGDAKTVTLPVNARSRTGLYLTDVVKAPMAASIVDLDGGGAAVELLVVGTGGWSATACASTASEEWYFATGSTDRDTTQLISLLNPFPDDAIVDLSFATDQGPSAPAEFQGLIVPARGLLVVNIADHVRRRSDVATTAKARAGRIVAGQYQVYGTPTPGVVLNLGAPSPGPTWTFPEGSVTNGQIEQYRIYNPGNREAELQLSFSLDQGTAEPFALTVPPQTAMTFVANDQARIPKGVGHSAVLTSTNGVGVVAERLFIGAKPSLETGVGATLGARRTATDWALPVGATNKTTVEVVSLFNPGPHPSTVSINAVSGGQMVAIPGLQALAIPSGGRLAVALNEHIISEDLGVVVAASEPVAVERDLYRFNGTGISLAMAIPLS